MIEEVVMETGKSRHNLLDMSRITAWVLSFEFSLPSSSFSVTLFIILKQITMTMSFLFVRLNGDSLSLSLSLSFLSFMKTHVRRHAPFSYEIGISKAKQSGVDANNQDAWSFDGHGILIDVTEDICSREFAQSFYAGPNGI